VRIRAAISASRASRSRASGSSSPSRSATARDSACPAQYAMAGVSRSTRDLRGLGDQAADQIDLRARGRQRGL
jgi:hypothetical protein